MSSGLHVRSQVLVEITAPKGLQNSNPQLVQGFVGFVAFYLWTQRRKSFEKQTDPTQVERGSFSCVG